MIKYVLLFLEGFLAFISPCILPMIPIYLMYLAGYSDEVSTETNKHKKNLLLNTLSFILGFTILFVALGATATTLGKYMVSHMGLFRIIFGIVIILLGLNTSGILNIAYLNRTKRLDFNTKNLNVFSSLLFGMAFSVGWSPCVGPFLGAALGSAAMSNSVLSGILQTFVFSMGLGVPFFITAILFDKLKFAFDFVKKHYTIIKLISGVFLIIFGICMVFDLTSYWAALF